MRARRRFGQHFLEPAWIEKVVRAIDPQSTDRLLEIGPGHGALTRPLTRLVASTLAVEVDRDLAAALVRAQLPNFTLVTADILEVDLAATLAGWLGAPPGPDHRVRVVGNLPYNISSPILFRLLDVATATGGIADATLMLQKEVADRLVAGPGNGDYGVLTILTALRADVRRVLALPPGAFRPAPKVHSAVVTLTFRPPTVDVEDEALFTRLVRTVFTQRRKTLLNGLRPFAEGRAGAPTAAAALAAASLDPGRRPETLSLAEFARLADAFAREIGPGVLSS